MKIKNLTPHSVRIFSADGKTEILTVPPSGIVARVAVTRTQVYTIDPGLPNPGPGDNWPEIPVFTGTYGQVENLPAAHDETVFIVSMLVRSAVPDRKDVLSPGDLIRDEKGQPVGCRGLEATA